MLTSMKRPPMSSDSCVCGVPLFLHPRSAVHGEGPTVPARFGHPSIRALQGRAGSPAHEGSRRVGAPSTQRLSDSGHVNIRAHPPVEPAREVPLIIAPRTVPDVSGFGASLG